MQQNILQIIIPLLLFFILLFVFWRLRLKSLAVYKSDLLGKIEVLEKYNGERMLTTNSYPQGISIEKEDINKSYWFCLADQAVKFCRKKENPRVLILGLGANTTSNLIAKLDSRINLTIVEIDSHIIEACQRFFDLDKLSNCSVIQADAFQLLNRKNAFPQKFDAIIVDIFVSIPPYVSLNSSRPDFIKKLASHLKSDGAILFNRPGHNENIREDGKLLEDHLKTLFQKTQIFDIKDPRGYRNYIISGCRTLA